MNTEANLKELSNNIKEDYQGILENHKQIQDKSLTLNEDLLFSKTLNLQVTDMLI